MNAQDTTVLLQADDLVVNYGKARAVEGISFACMAGTTTALVGPNGAGKSSVMHALIGSLRGTAGRVSVAGASLDGLGPNARAARGVTLVPQGRHVFKSLTVEENLAVIADSLRLDRATIARGLERFPILQDRRRVLAGLLSGGEQQMLAIARALMSDPKVLLLDEPALGLAPGIVDQLMETVAQVATAGGAVVIAEPSTTTLRTEIDQGVIIQRGRVVATADGRALAETYHRVLGISG